MSESRTLARRGGSERQFDVEIVSSTLKEDGFLVVEKQAQQTYIGKPAFLLKPAKPSSIFSLIVWTVQSR